MSIISLPTLEAYLDVSLDETKLQKIVNSINAACLRIMHRPSLRVDRVEYPKIQVYSTSLFLNWPRISIASIHEDIGGFFGQVSGMFGDETELTLGTNYVYDPNDAKSPLLRIDGGFWSVVPGSVQIDYEWGWSTPPNDMLHACLRLAAIAWDSRFRDGGALAEETFGDYSYSLLAGVASTGNTGSDGDLIGIRQTIYSYALEVI